MDEPLGNKSFGFIGLGDLGGAIAHRMLDQGVDLWVYDTDKKAVHRLTEAGAKGSSSPKEMGQTVDVILCCLPHPRTLREVVLAENGLINGMASGSLVVDMSTSGPEAVREIGKILAERKIRMIDCPVGKGPLAAVKGDLTLMMGGDREACREIEALLGLVASKIYYCGPLGAGQIVKLANNLASCASLAVAVEAYTMAIKAGADLNIVTEVLPQTAADSWQLRNTVIDKIVRRRNFDPVFKLKLARKDLQLVIEMAEKFGAPSNCARGALAWFDQGLQAGYQDLDQGAIILAPNPSLKDSLESSVKV